MIKIKNITLCKIFKFIYIKGAGNYLYFANFIYKKHY